MQQRKDEIVLHNKIVNKTQEIEDQIVLHNKIVNKTQEREKIKLFFIKKIVNKT